MAIRRAAYFVMEKTRAATKMKAATTPLDFEVNAGKLYMHDESLRVYLWAKAENNINKMCNNSSIIEEDWQ